jgi:hypothetical protein
MNKIYICICIIELLVSCSSKINLTNQHYENSNKYKKVTFSFINDSICIYNQELLCDLCDTDRVMSMKFYYYINKNKIILRKMMSNIDSCYTLSKESMEKCYFLNEDYPENQVQSKKILSLIDIYGTFDIINDCIVYYKRGKIEFTGLNRCYDNYETFHLTFEKIN